MANIVNPSEMLNLFPNTRPHTLLWGGLQAACAKITVIGTPNHLNYCVMFEIYTQFIKLSSGSIITNWQPVGSRPIGDTLMKVWYSQ